MIPASNFRARAAVTSFVLEGRVSRLVHGDADGPAIPSRRMGELLLARSLCNPPYLYRVVALALLMVLPGILVGALVTAMMPWVGKLVNGFLVGGLVGAIFGACLEAMDWARPPEQMAHAKHRREPGPETSLSAVAMRMSHSPERKRDTTICETPASWAI